MKPVDLARAVDLPPPTIHRLVTGKSTRPYESSLKPIADYFSIDVNQLLGEEPLADDQAQNKTTKEPKEYITNKRNIQTKITEIKMLPWDHISDYTNPDTSFLEKIPFWGEISSYAFATIMPDSSMEPFIQKGSILFLDPTLKYSDRSYVLVHMKETKTYLVRQILIDADHQYLKPLNPDLSGFKMRLLHAEDEIIACLVEIRQNCRPQGLLESRRS